MRPGPSNPTTTEPNNVETTSQSTCHLLIHCNNAEEPLWPPPGFDRVVSSDPYTWICTLGTHKLSTYTCLLSVCLFQTFIDLLFIPSGENPSCLHTTLALFSFQESIQTVPHSLFLHISTLPSKYVPPPLNLTSPFSQFTVETLGVTNNTLHYNYIPELIQQKLKSIEQLRR